MYIENTIKSLDFFNTLKEHEIDLLASISSVHTYKKNYVLNYENKISSNLFFLSSGLAKAYKIDKNNNEIFLYNIYKNSLISDISDIYKNHLLSFSNIEILEESEILSINYPSFRKIFLNNNILCNKFTNEIILRSSKLQSLINREFIFDSIAKVAMIINSDIDMFNKLKRHEISLLLHIQPATLSRVLNKLKQKNIINIQHGKIIVLDKVALESIYS